MFLYFRVKKFPGGLGMGLIGFRRVCTLLFGWLLGVEWDVEEFWLTRLRMSQKGIYTLLKFEEGQV